jgi:hypoxanthine phosphoribosyltransferase
MRGNIGSILLTEDEITHRVKELGKQITHDYYGKEMTVICVLKGAVVFLADLVRNISVPMELDFIQMSSYGDGTKSSGNMVIQQNLTTDIKDRDILIVDDILDTGFTLGYLKNIILNRHPKSLKLCVFLDKNKHRSIGIKADYVGFSIPDDFVIGYGLDYAGHYRCLPYIARLEL